MVPGLACCAVGAQRCANAKPAKAKPVRVGAMPAARNLVVHRPLPSGATFALPYYSHTRFVDRPHRTLGNKFAHQAARPTSGHVNKGNVPARGGSYRGVSNAVLPYQPTVPQR